MVLMNFYNLHGCEIVEWVSKKSGCLWFPAKMMSTNLFEHTWVWYLIECYCWLMLTFTYVWYFYLFLEF